VPLLGEDSDWEIVLQWDGDRLGASGLNVAVGEDPSEFLDAGCVLSSFDHLVNPFGWGALLLTQSHACGRLLKTVGFQGMLEIMISLFYLLEGW